MVARPDAVAFDIIETTFSLSSLRPRLAAQGLPPSALDIWFPRTLRDAFALAATDTFAPFADVATATLEGVSRELGKPLDRSALDAVVSGFGALTPQPDAAAAFHVLADANIRIAALSNGAPATTRKLLDAAGLSPLVERVMSIADISTWKPRREIYLHAAGQMNVEPAGLMLVATHAWDTHGAKCAGLLAGFVARGQAYPPMMQRPDVVEESLLDMARAIVALPRD